MGQKKDLSEYRALLLKRHSDLWENSLMGFEMSCDYKNIHKCLKDYGIKEPYATNIMHRVFGQAFKVIEENRTTIYGQGMNKMK